MDPRIADAFAYIDRHEDALYRLWENLVRMESPSADKAAIEKVMAHVDTYCDALDMEREIYSYEKAGPTFAAWTAPGPGKPVALIGHLDTVHPIGAFGEDAFRVEGDEVHGPGCYDMKGGVAIELFTIRVLKALGYEDRQLKLVLSGDEEVAHAFSDGESGRMVEAHVEGCEAAFNCESGAANEDVTLERNGGGIVVVKVYGKAAHAGREPEKGASAILQAARMITELESRTILGEMQFNCGRIKGGSGANIVPDYCEFAIGLRYRTNEQYETAMRLIDELCRNPVVKGTHCEMYQNGYYPAMERTAGSEHLLAVYQEAARLAGGKIPLGNIRQGGCSDSSFATRIGVPTLCAIGVQGANNHQLTEVAYYSSLKLQCKKLVAAILML